MVLVKKLKNRVEINYQILFEKMFSGIAILEVIFDEHKNPIEYTILDVNAEFEKITGLAVDSLKDKTIDEVSNKFDASWIDALGSVVKTGKSISFENFSSSIGKYLETSFILSQNGLVVINVNDITQRKKTEIALSVSERELAAVFKSSPLIILLLDANCNVLKVDQSVLNITGMNELELINKQPGFVINCVYSNQSKEGCGHGIECPSCMIRNSINATLEKKEGVQKKEAKILIGKNDNVYDRDVIITTEYLEINKKPVIFLSVEDVTEKVQMENILIEKTSILLKAQEMARIGEFYYFINDNSFKLSASLQKILDFNKQQVTLDEFLNKIHPDDHLDILQELNRAITFDNRCNLYLRLLKNNNEIQYINVQLELERVNKGKPARAFGVAIDITEQKNAEQTLIYINTELEKARKELLATNENLKENNVALERARQKAEESDMLKSAFLANMSHEIRTPMNAIMGFSDLLDLEDLSFDKRKKFTSIIRERTKDLLNIINDILDLSRIESNTLKLVESDGNINNVLLNLRDFFMIRNEEFYSKPIEFRVYNKLDSIQHFIRTDFERVKQVLINLLDNAFKFTFKGQIHFGCELKDDSTLLFRVSDSGIGIARDKQNLIFERFRQANDSHLNREFGGVGLGLSISKGIIELMKGTIWLESEPGKGTTFFFTIPYVPKKLVAQSNSVSVKTLNRFKGKNILIVEDIQYNQDYLKEILIETGANVYVADSGVSALQLYNTLSNLDIVLMDIRLPDQCGIELTKLMKKEKPEIKIIAQTAYATGDDREKCIEAGCVDFISKPISKPILIDMLGKYLFS